MHFDIAHALVTVALVYAVIWIMHRQGFVKFRSEGGPRWSWPMFGAIFVVVLVLNLLWPAG